MNQTKELKPKISELKDEYEQRLKDADKAIEFWKGKYYEIEQVIKDLEELLK